MNQPNPITESNIIERVALAKAQIKSELAKVIVGQEETLEQIIIGLFSRGHCLLQGVPGLGKTLLIKCIGDLFDLSFKRIQFTPDLMPSDIFGTEVLEENDGEHNFRFIKGPVFTNLLLADEINRTPPKTQAALLEAMEEKHVTVAGNTYPLDAPFFVLATQNPIESEGTYPLPEAQLDRFLLNIRLDYLSLEDEIAMVSKTTSDQSESIQTLFNAEEIRLIQDAVRRVPASDYVIRYAVKLVTASRPDSSSDDFIKANLRWGAGSRASQALILTAKARALLDGRLNVSVEDIQALAKPVLRHRLVTNFNAAANSIDAEKIIQHLLDTIEA